MLFEQSTIFNYFIKNQFKVIDSEFCQENTLFIANTLFQQHKRRFYIWSSPDGQYWNQIDYIICSQRWRSSIQSKPKMEKLYTVSKIKTGSWLWLRSRTPYSQIQAEIEESRGTTRPFRYDLNQILYDDTVEVTNRVKGLDMIECLKNYGQRFVILYRRQGSRPSPRKRNAKRQNGCLRRRYN